MLTDIKKSIIADNRNLMKHYNPLDFTDEEYQQIANEAISVQLPVFDNVKFLKFDQYPDVVWVEYDERIVGFRKIANRHIPIVILKEYLVTNGFYSGEFKGETLRVFVDGEAIKPLILSFQTETFKINSDGLLDTTFKIVECNSTVSQRKEFEDYLNNDYALDYYSIDPDLFYNRRLKLAKIGDGELTLSIPAIKEKEILKFIFKDDELLVVIDKFKTLPVSVFLRDHCECLEWTTILTEIDRVKDQLLTCAPGECNLILEFDYNELRSTVVKKYRGGSCLIN